MVPVMWHISSGNKFIVKSGCNEQLIAGRVAEFSDGYLGSAAWHSLEPVHTFYLLLFVVVTWNCVQIEVQLSTPLGISHPYRTVYCLVLLGAGSADLALQHCSSISPPAAPLQHCTVLPVLPWCHAPRKYRDFKQDRGGVFHSIIKSALYCRCCYCIFKAAEFPVCPQVTIFETLHNRVQ